MDSASPTDSAPPMDSASPMDSAPQSRWSSRLSVDWGSPMDSVTPSRWGRHIRVRGLGASAVPTRGYLNMLRRIKFGILLHVSCFVLLTLSIVDRLFWNVWPRQTYKIGRGNAGTDSMDYEEGPFFVQFYEFFARVSGRSTIVGLNYLFLTKMHNLLDLLRRVKRVRRVIDFSDMVEACRVNHYWMGWLTVWATLLHVYSILLPAFHGWRLAIVVGNFEYPLSERKPKGVKGIEPQNKTMNLQVDDVWRIILMTVLLGVLVPISIAMFSGGGYWKKVPSHWQYGIHIHNFMAVMYFIDIVRRHTHPHSWILNTPFFLLWVLDISIGAGWYYKADVIRSTDLDHLAAEPIGRTMAAVKVLDAKYFVLDVAGDWIKTGAEVLAGRIAVNLSGQGWLERAHQFSCYCVDDVEGDGKRHKKFRVVCKVFPDDERKADSRLRRWLPGSLLWSSRTLTGRIWDYGMDQDGGKNVVLKVFPPRNSDNDERLTACISNGNKKDVVCMLGTGSGVNFILEGLRLWLHLREKRDDLPILVLLHICNSAALHDFVRDEVGRICGSYQGKAANSVFPPPSPGQENSGLARPLLVHLVQTRAQRDSQETDNGPFHRCLREKIVKREKVRRGQMETIWAAHLNKYVGAQEGQRNIFVEGSANASTMLQTELANAFNSVTALPSIGTSVRSHALSSRTFQREQRLDAIAGWMSGSDTESASEPSGTASIQLEHCMAYDQDQPELDEDGFEKFGGQANDVPLDEESLDEVSLSL